MSMLKFDSDGVLQAGYLVLPASANGNGVLVLHAWWGLTDFFKSVCERIAAAGFVVFAPDLHHGKTASTVEEATHLVQTSDFPATQATAEAGLKFLQAHPLLQNGGKVGAVGFSFGAAYAILLDELHPGALAGIVLFYGGSDMDFSSSQTKIQGHFAETDEWESMENIQKVTAPHFEKFIYPGTGHWFVEENQPLSYKPEAAALAWKRTLDFLNRTLTS